MGNYTIFLMFENPRRSRQARNFTENDPKILDLKSSSEQIIFQKLSLGAPEASRGVRGACSPRKFFGLISTPQTPLSWAFSGSFRQDISQISTWEVFY